MVFQLPSFESKALPFHERVGTHTTYCSEQRLVRENRVAHNYLERFFTGVIISQKNLAAILSHVAKKNLNTKVRSKRSARADAETQE